MGARSSGEETRPLDASIVSGGLLIHAAPMISGALLPSATSATAGEDTSIAIPTKRGLTCRLNVLQCHMEGASVIRGVAGSVPDPCGSERRTRAAAGPQCYSATFPDVQEARRRISFRVISAR